MTVSLSVVVMLAAVFELRLTCAQLVVWYLYMLQQTSVTKGIIESLNALFVTLRLSG